MKNATVRVTNDTPDSDFYCLWLEEQGYSVSAHTQTVSEEDAKRLWERFCGLPDHEYRRLAKGLATR